MVCSGVVGTTVVDVIGVVVLILQSANRGSIHSRNSALNSNPSGQSNPIFIGSSHITYLLQLLGYGIRVPTGWL